MRIKFHRVERKEEPTFRSNTQIRVPEVFVIDETNEALGVMSIEDALAKAQEAELDLVEVNPKANPPVVKIVNLGQLKYEREKQAHKQKMQQKKVETKNIRLTFRISEHDQEMRVLQAEKFLAKENKTIIENAKSSLAKYNDARHRFQYLSNETLIHKYQTSDIDNCDNMEQLALEEELVKRNILNHSPMHEKMEKINNYFKS